MQQKLLNRLEEIKSLGEKTLSSRKRVKGLGELVNGGQTDGFKAAALSFVERIYGKEHSYYISLNSSMNGHRPSDIESGIEILSSIEQEISGDWLFTLKGLLAAELFADFLEMAKHLRNESS